MVTGVITELQQIWFHSSGFLADRPPLTPNANKCMHFFAALRVNLLCCLLLLHIQCETSFKKNGFHVFLRLAQDQGT